MTASSLNKVHRKNVQGIGCQSVGQRQPPGPVTCSFTTFGFGDPSDRSFSIGIEPDGILKADTQACSQKQTVIAGVLAPRAAIGAKVELPGRAARKRSQGECVQQVRVFLQPLEPVDSGVFREVIRAWRAGERLLRLRAPLWKAAHDSCNSKGHFVHGFHRANIFPQRFPDSCCAPSCDSGSSPFFTSSSSSSVTSSKCLGRKTALAMSVGTTALTITVATR